MLQGANGLQRGHNGNQQKGYNGNILLKKSGVQHSFTPGQVKTYAKCSTDILHFISNYCKIITLDEGLKLFKPYEYQERMVKSFDDNRFNIAMLPRQSGKCLAYDTNITVRNKKSKEVIDISIGDFLNKLKADNEKI